VGYRNGGVRSLRLSRVVVSGSSVTLRSPTGTEVLISEAPGDPGTRVF
jgi:hypothetical protein